MKMNMKKTSVPCCVNNLTMHRLRRHNAHPLGRALLALTLCVGLSACAGVTPWVKPYERQNLATPAMSWSRDSLADGYMHHVYQARESARGAEGGSGGGCGCN